ncbi:hypothetical protein PybrP1_006317 [[Pythium] brassicae (nom. inval.)]|nr:hypothetical protein PybrP1_006317 [[Pythium] brassicae (nom. inval.)]
MEAIAAFVFARGGAARPDEIEDLFMQWPELRVEVLASGASLKKAVKRDGATHGLVWRDEHPLERGPVIVHEMTEAQRDGDRELRSGALYDFYNAFPRESAFMKRRSGGVVAFARHGE